MNTLNFFRSRIARIEILNDQSQNLQLIFFEKPVICQYLSNRTKEDFLETVDRNSSNDKINGLLDNQYNFLDEMRHFEFLSQNIPIRIDFFYPLFRSIDLALYFLLNFLILFDQYNEDC